MFVCKVALSLVEQVLPFPAASSSIPPVTEQDRLRAKAAELKQVPVTEDDERMDWIVTAEGVRKT